MSNGMKKLLIPLVAVAALALPASALAWGSHHTRAHHYGRHENGKFVRFDRNVKAGGTSNVVKLSGTGTSFGVDSASITGSTFTGTLATTWSSATTKTVGGNSVSCAPATASITLGSAAAVSYTGKTCSWTANGATKYVFYGSASDGGRALLSENGVTVIGSVITGDNGLHMGVLMFAHMTGCDHH